MWRIGRSLVCFGAGGSKKKRFERDFGSGDGDGDADNDGDDDDGEDDEGVGGDFGGEGIVEAWDDTKKNINNDNDVKVKNCRLIDDDIFGRYSTLKYQQGEDWIVYFVARGEEEFMSKRDK